MALIELPSRLYSAVGRRHVPRSVVISRLYPAALFYRLKRLPRVVDGGRYFRLMGRIAPAGAPPADRPLKPVGPDATFVIGCMADVTVRRSGRLWVFANDGWDRYTLPHIDSDGEAKFDFSICDTTLNPNVLNGVHALAADEWRDIFSPTFWAERSGVVQHIFPGTHSNVGGGYPERGLSDGALAWMLDQLEALGLPTDRRLLAPPLSANALDVARDDGAVFPDNQTPRRPRAFPSCAQVNPFLKQRVDHPVEMVPTLAPEPYKPRGVYADGASLV